MLLQKTFVPISKPQTCCRRSAKVVCSATSTRNKALVNIPSSAWATSLFGPLAFVAAPVYAEEESAAIESVSASQLVSDAVEGVSEAVADAVEETKAVVEEVSKAVSETAQASTEALSDAASVASESLSAAVEETKTVVEEVSSAVVQVSTEAISDAASVAVESFSAAVEETKAVVEEVSQAVSETVQVSTEVISDAASTAAESLSDAVSETAAAASDAAAAAAAQDIPTFLGFSPVEWILLLSPILVYSLFTVYRAQVNPKAGVSDLLLIVAALLILGNIGSIVFLKVRFF